MTVASQDSFCCVLSHDGPNQPPAGQLGLNTGSISIQKKVYRADGPGEMLLCPSVFLNLADCGRPPTKEVKGGPWLVTACTRGLRQEGIHCRSMLLKTFFAKAVTVNSVTAYTTES